MVISLSINKIKRDIGLLCIIAGCAYLSGYAYSIVGGAEMKIVALGISALGCLLVRPSIKLPGRITLAGILIGGIATGSIMSFLLFSDQNLWLDPVILVSRILIAFMITERIRFNKFAEKFSTVMCILTICALFIWILVKLKYNVPCFSYIGLNGSQYHTIWLCTWMENSDRLMGPFWEPGLYASFAILGILCEGCFRGKPIRLGNIFILLSGILLSQSTAGYILAIMAIYVVFRKNVRNFVWNFIIVLAILFVLFGNRWIIEIISQINPGIFGKLVEENISANTRMLSPLVCMNLFWESPFTGLGMSYSIAQYNLYKPVYHIDSLTSTTTFMLSAFGIWGISYTVVTIAGIWRLHLPAISKCVILLIFMLIVNKEPHYSIMLTYIFIFYFCKNTIEREKRKRNVSTAIKIPAKQIVDLQLNRGNIT